MPWYVIVGLVGAGSFLWLPLLGRLYACAIYGFGTWDSWMAEDVPGEFGPYVPRWRRSGPSWTELVRQYRALAKEARAEAVRADEVGLDESLWQTLALTWDDAAQHALARRFAEECTCPDHRPPRKVTAS